MILNDQHRLEWGNQKREQQFLLTEGNLLEPLLMHWFYARIEDEIDADS
jgi:hypothetical protein